MRDVEHLQNMLERTRTEFTKKYCLHPKAPSECSGKIISAHSVQRSLLKKFITENGHVVQIKMSAHVDPIGNLVKPESVGINNASTFFGFCSRHDSELFRPLESETFKFEPRQIALLGYRAVCRELYSKDAEIAAADSMRDYCAVNPDIRGFKEKDVRHQIMQLARYNARTNLTNSRERYKAMLSDEKQLRYYAIEFADTPVYFCSVAFLPEWDFEGGRLQNLSSIAEYKPISFSAWASGSRSAAVFCWHESADDICVPFVDSLRKCTKDRVANRILSMAFEVSENVVFRADWWESISETDRERQIDRALSGLPNLDRKSDCLADDGSLLLKSLIAAEHVHYDTPPPSTVRSK